MLDIDRSINKILEKGKSVSIGTPNKQARKKSGQLTMLARSSIFFPFTQPTVRSPRGKIVKGKENIMDMKRR